MTTIPINLSMTSKLQAPLNKDDVEVRVGSNHPTGFKMLLYKTARTDMKRLNEACGMQWANKHSVDAKGNVTCSIGIKNLDEWIFREDTGSESMTEKEKGSYSDSFKRAGFRWGIGLELYDAPLIWVKTEMINKGSKEKPKYAPKDIKQMGIKISKYEYKNNEIFIELKYKTDVIFTNFKRYETN